MHLSLELEREPDWICITSQNAVRCLEENRESLLNVPCAAMGWSSSRRLRQIGFKVEIDGTATAQELAARLLEQKEPPKLVLWPRGSMSDDLGRFLNEAGVDVCQPVVYETNERIGTGHFPEADVIFFASPSAVRAHSRRVAHGEASAEVAIAIGPTTLRALQSSDTVFFPRVLSLDRALPAELGQMLVGIELEM